MKTWRIFGFDYSPEEVMQAHQWLYYVGPSKGFGQIWTDLEYDMWCKSHGFDGDGGSDLDSDYSQKVKAMAISMHNNPSQFPPTRFT